LTIGSSMRVLRAYFCAPIEFVRYLSEEAGSERAEPVYGLKALPRLPDTLEQVAPAFQDLATGEMSIQHWRARVAPSQRVLQQQPPPSATPILRTPAVRGSTEPRRQVFPRGIREVKFIMIGASRVQCG